MAVNIIESMLREKDMPSMKGSIVCRPVRSAMLAALLVATPLASAVAAQASQDVVATARAQAVQAWHDNINRQAPPADGCFRATYPSAVWTAERCGPVPSFRSVQPADAVSPASSRSTVSARTESSVFNTGNGYDYAARTGQLTRSATGSFPTVTGVSSGSDDYSLQINTNMGSNTSACQRYGYSSCQVWEQFIYSTDPGTGSPGAFIQNWFYVSDASAYRRTGCPSGWNAYSAQLACYRNSNLVSVDYVPITSIGSIKLAGSASVNGNDTVTFTVNGVAHSVSQSGSTLAIGSVWKNSEFNIFGNGSNDPVASFNSGSSVSVKVAVNDGTTNAPTCVGPNNGGTTGEENNLTLGRCTASGGSTPSIQFAQSN